ncbi:MAG: AraC family transcriptional regulator [Flammeovirgaceae bacterium]
MNSVDVLDINAFDDADGKVGFYCNNFKTHLINHHKTITVPHKHNFFLTVIFTQGTGIHEIDFERYAVQSGSVFMLNPGQAHYWELSDDIEGIIFFHSQEFFDLSFTKQSIYDFPFFYSVHNPSALFISQQEMEPILTYFQQLLAEYRQKRMLSKPKVVSLLNCIYIDLSRMYLGQETKEVLKPDVYAGHLRNLEMLIDTHFKTEKSPSAYAEMLHITIRHLNRLTQQSLGKSPTQLITERIMLEAKRMMVYDSSSLSRIANELGYEDYPYFSRLFKKWVGISPSAFSNAYKADG